MILYLLRHAQAGEHLAGRADDARRLTLDGRKRMRQAAAGMRRLGLRFDAILTSPLPRAAETAAIVAKAYDGRPPPQLIEALACRVASADAITALTPLAAREHVMIVGHEPQLSAVASILLTGSPERLRIQLKKGGCLALDLSSGLEAGRAELLWLLTQRQLRRLRK
ncbi:MAG TPA: phosphohistidine phosphatase SixA [Candidatus Binataceae bacterium]|nr:phosphohistidine phosphatase SixA [Candidatus Binataceae bacterium]